jgi:uncharacterized protein YeaO (DUF488 family)
VHSRRATPLRTGPQPSPAMRGEATINLHRVHGGALPKRGRRVLVERLWPRGVKKSDLPVDIWLKEAAPSTGLRQWFGHDPAKWEEFRRRYFRELNANPGSWVPLLEAARHGDVTLVYSSRDTEHNNAVALREYLLAKLEGKAAAKHAPSRSRAA